MDFRLRKCAPTYALSADGRHVATVEQIGRGAWCRAFRPVEQEQTDDTVYLIVHEDDSSKAILSECDSPHIPELQRIGMYGDTAYVWRTRFYRRLTAKDKDAWRQYRLLQRAAHDVQMMNYRSRVGYGAYCWGHDEMAATVDRVEELGERELAEALLQLVNASACYGQTWTFEFAPRNLATDSTGRLILLDPVFDMEVIARKREDARKRAERRW
jgi:hypothetical protein